MAKTVEFLAILCAVGLILCLLGNFACLFCRLLIFFKIILKKKIRNTIRVSNSLDPDQARHFVRPDLGPNCLQSLSKVRKKYRHVVISLGFRSKRPIFNTSQQYTYGHVFCNVVFIFNNHKPYFL